MWAQTRRPGWFMVCLQKPTKEMIPIICPAPQYAIAGVFHTMPAHRLRSSGQAAVICLRLGMPDAHVLAHRAKPYANQVRTPVAAYYGWDINA